MIENTSLQPIDILLVDDRPENLLTLEAVLNSPYYNLIKANSGDEALKYLLDHDPAIILMDVQMPDLDGFETAAIIKKSERTREIPIIFITAINKDESFVHKGYDYGAVDYIYKPFDAHILKAKVAIFADLYRKTQRLIEAERKIRDSEKKDRERKLAQLELKNLKREQSDQKKYRDLVEGIHHGVVWSADLETLAFTFISPSSEQILGFSPDEWSVEKDFWIQHVFAEDRAEVLNALKKLRQNKQDMGLEHRFVRADGQVIWLHTGMRIARREDEKSYELRGLSIDITKNKQAEEVLRLSKEHSEFSATASLALSESLDHETIISRVTGLVVPKLADRFAIELLDGKPDSGISLSGREMTVPLISRGKTLGMMRFIYEASGRQYTGDDLLIAEDLARRSAAAIDNANLYKQAQDAIRARDEFLSIASHELKTPLTPLKIQTQSLMRTLTTTSLADVKPERITKMLQSSDRQLARLAKLIDDLLDISRINIGRLNLNFEEFDVCELIVDVVDRFKDQLAATKCEVRFEIVAPITVVWDRFRVEQVIVNLLTNAMKYGPGKPIEITLAERGGVVKLAVKDNGIGIAKEDQQRIFGRFERAVSGNNFGGLGLGLYIVTQILAAHNGQITVESELGAGSTFTVELPIRVSPDSGSNAGSAA